MARTQGPTKQSRKSRPAGKASPRTAERSGGRGKGEAGKGERTSGSSRSEPLRLHRSIYSKRAVKESAEAFSELAEVTVTTRGDYHEVSMTPVSTESSVDVLIHEFTNYALSRAASLR